MNDKDKEAFDKWFQNIYDSYIEFRDWQGCDITFDKKEDMRIGWQVACDYKQKEIDELKNFTYWKISQELEAENAKLRECLSNWISWEQKQINTHGEYCGEEIKKLISDARQVLKELDLN